ncbi:MAG: four helix bundle protein [Planctomycetaceae bacterium]|nr:four helix bundle protein [Planctomycetaceae bacterium]
MSVKDYRDLIVWEKGMELAESVYSVSSQFPKSETYGLVSQIRKAAVSVPSNIAEGQGRYSDADFARFLSIANGSVKEVETQLLLAVRLSYVQNIQIHSCMNLCSEIARLIAGLRNKLHDKMKATEN